MMVRCIFLAMALALAAAPLAYAKDGAQAPWIKDEKSVDGTARIFLSPSFTTIQGKFTAVPESMTDRRASIEGTYLMGTYRYLFTTPETGQDGKRSDELVSTEVLDCRENFFGTAKQVRKYKGKVVSERVTPLAGITMVQTMGPNIGAKLCALAQAQKPAPLERGSVTNPGYNPEPTEKDVDRIIDKYAAPRK